MMQDANSNSVMGMLMAQPQSHSSKAVSGLAPQMGRLPDEEQEQSDSPNMFANMLFMLQAGVEDSTSEYSNLQASGNALPDDGQALPVFDENQSTDMPMQTSFLANSNQVFPPEDLGLNQAQAQLQSPQVLNQTSIATTTTIDEARKIAKQLGVDGLSEYKTDGSEINSVEVEKEQPETNASVVINSGALQGQALADSAVKSGASTAATSSQVDVKSLDKKNRASALDIPLNLRTQAGGSLAKEELGVQSTASESEGIDLEEAFLSNPSTLADNSKTAQTNLSSLNQGQPQQLQNIQSLNIQAGQLQSSVVVNPESNPQLDALVEVAKEKPAASVHEQINQQISKEDQLYLGKQSQFWGRQLGSHITTLIKQDVQEAKIHLDPPELGSLEIKLQVQNQETKIQIHASQPQVRDVLEQQAFRLREALAQEGMNLSGFDVSSGNKDQADQEQPQGQGSSFNEGALSELDGDAEPGQIQNKATASSLNLIDTFA